MIWYRELGFYSNPLSIKPGSFHNDVIGYDLSEVFEKIDRSQPLFIEGGLGYGKTTILKHVITKFGGRKQIVYYNCSRVEDTINVEGLLRERDGFLGRLFGGLPFEMIMLLDEVEKISPKDQKDLYRLYKEGNIKSIVFFGTDFYRVGFNLELRRLMVNNVIKLTQLTEGEAVELVRKRIGNLQLLSDKIIKTVFKSSDFNPRLMLENLEDLCKYAVENNEEEITEEHLKEVLKIHPKTEVKKKKAQKKTSKAQKKTPVREEEIVAVKPEEEPTGAVKEIKPKSPKKKADSKTKEPPAPEESPTESSKPEKDEEKEEAGEYYYYY